MKFQNINHFYQNSSNNKNNNNSNNNNDADDANDDDDLVFSSPSSQTSQPSLLSSPKLLILSDVLHSFAMTFFPTTSTLNISFLRKDKTPNKKTKQQKKPFKFIGYCLIEFMYYFLVTSVDLMISPLPVLTDLIAFCQCFT